MKSELKSAIFTSLTPELKKHDFSLKRATNSFVRQRGEVTDQFQLVFLDGRPGYRIQPNVGVRIDRVENIFHQTSGWDPKYQKDTPTMGSSVGILLTGDSRSCEVLLEKESQVGPVAERIEGVFHEFVLPFFERWGSLIAIDAGLNDKPAERTHLRHLAWERCSTGIIVAKLVGRRDYDQLADFYMGVMSGDSKGFYLKRFQALLKSLESVKAGNDPVQ